MLRKPVETLNENLNEVRVLLTIHEFTTGKKAGRRDAAFATLNKSGVVLLVACWEAFIEDLAERTFSALCRKTQNPSRFPKEIQKLIVKYVKEDKHELRVLDLSGHGWKAVFNDYKKVAVKKYITSLNTPTADNIDDLFRELIGIHRLSKSWSWKRTRSNVTPARARERLIRLIKLRHEIAHHVNSKSGATVRKDVVEKNLDFIEQLAQLSNERVNNYLKTLG